MLLLNLFAALVILLVPTLWLDHTFGRAFWELGSERLRVVVALPLAYGIAAGVLGWRGRKTPVPWFEIVLVAAAVSGAVIVGVIRREEPASRVMLASSATLTWLLLFAVFWVRGWRRAKTAVLASLVLVATVLHLAYPMGYLGTLQQPEATEQIIRTGLYAIKVRNYSKPFPLPLQSGGAIARLWDDYLVATGDGDLLRFSEAADHRRLDVRRLALRVPTNPAEFRAAAGGLGLQATYFRVADIHTRIGTDRVTLFATYHFWHADSQCVTMRLSTAEIFHDTVRTPPPTAWSTLFETKPCLPITLSPRGTPFFGGHQIGGQLADFGNGKLLMAIGDQEYDGVTAPTAYGQDVSVSYGKTYIVDPATGDIELFTIGHRNPEGLYVDSAGRVYSSEHGPEGGDELNRLEAGKNYGWPIVSYGVEYGTDSWPASPQQGRHEGFAQPLFAWVPAIGPSSLIGLTSPLFPLWRGDLLLTSLRAQAIWRIRLLDGRVVLVEPIQLNMPMRDIIEGHNGELIIWNERRPGPHVLFLTPSEGSNIGEAEFGQCAGCHQIGNGTAHGIGPDLAGIYGRRIASREGYTYSEALMKLGGTWTRERLDAFLENPSLFAPGNGMRTAGIGDPDVRRRLLKYLRSL